MPADMYFEQSVSAVDGAPLAFKEQTLRGRNFLLFSRAHGCAQSGLLYDNESWNVSLDKLLVRRPMRSGVNKQLAYFTNRKADFTPVIQTTTSGLLAKHLGHLKRVARIG